MHARIPAEAASSDPEVLRAALIRETTERRRAECQAGMQAEIVQLAVDLLVQQPDIQGFFGALTKTMVEEGESYTCGVWLIDDSEERCELWLAYVKDRLFTARDRETAAEGQECPIGGRFPCENMADHLFEHKDGWTRTIEYVADDPRLPELLRRFCRDNDVDSTITTPLRLGDRTLGWMTVSCRRGSEPENQWWRVELIEAIARQAALALHHSRVVERSRSEERSKAILEERNRLARDIHDNLAQGFAAILMQLQGARREMCTLTPAAAASLETAIDLARTHLTEARRSVGTLRPYVGSGEDIATAIKRLADLGQRTSGVPIDVLLEELPRAGDGVEREIVSIAQEALTNALRHADARRVTIRASTVRSIGLRVSVSDDGRGIARDRKASGFGMTSMQERADKIGASLTIVTAPKSGTEVVLAWEPSALPTQVYVAN
ncbi:MAG TPA: GAF domain-containing sensor histidine kinase [Vicinamibacterales bacterium]|nr:GAF domain-containing sensor histidine kinase [Vicinamibacterales bacterium]